MKEGRARSHTILDRSLRSLKKSEAVPRAIRRLPTILFVLRLVGHLRFVEFYVRRNTRAIRRSTLLIGLVSLPRGGGRVDVDRRRKDTPMLSGNRFAVRRRRWRNTVDTSEFLTITYV